MIIYFYTLTEVIILYRFIYFLNAIEIIVEAIPALKGLRRIQVKDINQVTSKKVVLNKIIAFIICCNIYKDLISMYLGSSWIQYILKINIYSWVVYYTRNTHMIHISLDSYILQLNNSLTMELTLVLLGTNQVISSRSSITSRNIGQFTNVIF